MPNQSVLVKGESLSTMFSWGENGRAPKWGLWYPNKFPSSRQSERVVCPPWPLRSLPLRPAFLTILHALIFPPSVLFSITGLGSWPPLWNMPFLFLPFHPRDTSILHGLFQCFPLLRAFWVSSSCQNWFSTPCSPMTPCSCTFIHHCTSGSIISWISVFIPPTRF